MDRSALARKRRQDAPLPAIPNAEVRQDKRMQQERLRRPASGKIRTAKDSNEIIRVPRRTEPLDRPSTTSTDDDLNARHFTVANVGAGGTLYLKPSRMPPPSFTQPLATPPGTSDGGADFRTEWPSERQSNVSTSWTPRLQPARVGGYDHSIPVPPLSLSNGQPKRRPRSHSFSTVSERMRSPTFSSNDFQLLVNGQDTGQRPKSSVDLSGGFLDLHIPHYRLGTPRFSDRGTAYLHSSMYTNTTTDDMRSSVFSRADYDKLFPAPPGRAHGSIATSRNNSSPYLHPSAAGSLMTPSRTPPTPPTVSPLNGGGGITPAAYDKVEANSNNPSIVRYHATTGKIVAATPARLVAQITSPLFLDYELLSDFFLTYRSFLSCQDLLEYLLARMKWAMGTPTDAGRIVRVRTFVAVRHWILNYFADDFALDVIFRQRFCDLVNDLAHALYGRSDHGGSDMNIIGEMKKCWRRTCAMFWPATDALDASPKADIVPGGDQSSQGFAASTASLPLMLQPKRSKADFRRVSAPLQIPTESRPQVDGNVPTGNESTLQAFGPESAMTTRTASIPASPMSEQSLQVLSCSVPFLRHMRPSEKATERSGSARPSGPQRNPPLSGGNKSNKSSHQHKRSGSFSDALRDGRAPLPSGQGQSVDIRSLPVATFTGGLVRGLLLQPSPAKVDLLIPISPGLDTRGVRFGGIEENYFEDKSGQNLGVKRLVGDVRRALSSRKGRHESPTSSQKSANSYDSRSSANLVPVTNTKTSQPSAWQQLRGPPRTDILGARIGDSYREAFHAADLPDPADEEAHQQLVVKQQRQRETDVPPEEHELIPPRPNPDRWNSRVTTGDRSILIMDDTGTSEEPALSGALPSVSSMSSSMAPQPLFRKPEEVFSNIENQRYGPGSRSLRQSASYAGERMHGRRSSEIPMHDLLAVPQRWSRDQAVSGDTHLSPTAHASARKSSSAQPGLQMPLAPPQLRRRPGGDLKAADHVHELEPSPLPHDFRDSFSTMSASQATSAVHSRELSGTHFSGQDFGSWRLPSHRVSGRAQDSVGLLDWDSSQPNLRPSFQAEVSSLARMGDHSHIGGIEDALLKLEGKAGTPTDSTFTGTESDMPPVTRQKPQVGPLRVINASISADGSTSVEADSVRRPKTETQGASIYHLSGSDETGGYRLQSVGSSELYGWSEAQDSAAPVLPKSSDVKKFPVHDLTLMASSDKPVALMDRPTVSEEAGNATGTVKSDSPPKSATPHGSFLLDDNESLSDISTEIADQPEDDSLGVRSFFFDDTVDDDDVLPQSFRAPPTPPSTVGAPHDQSPERDIGNARVPNEAAPHLKEAQSAPKLLSPNLDRQRAQQQPLPAADLRRTKTAPGPETAAHLPFLLAFESETVAEQLTIIEKDALDEVDWKDLIGLNWQQSPPHVRNWVDFLKADNCTGIDIVVARFNLVVKWVVSETLLTEAPTERARCITKLIHIATHCRRFRNYASMYQITLGLLSADLARLHMTWALVAPAEKHMLERLEKLCQPIRNFSNLRQEMETSTADSGCIPFIGLYTHDLMFNAQKPAHIDPTPPSKELLINFERYQTAATIVKSLLRLIEASSKYIFHPHPEALSRCLWLAALEDAEISARSKTLEQ